MAATLTTGALVVFGLIAVALVLFVTEWLPPDITAIGVLVSLAVLEPYTGVSASAAISGFASPATVTIIAMYVLSAGVEDTGIVDYLGSVLADVTGGDERKLLGATIGTTGVAAGIVNNTPVVAVFIPMITGLSERYGISPSKLLMPLSYAAMLGGTLTLIGTSTNLLASDLSRDLLGRPLSMFEFTPVGVVVLLTGLAYLMTVGQWLVPERVPATADFTEEFDLDRHLNVLEVREGSPLVGRTVADAFDEPSDGATDADPVAAREPAITRSDLAAAAEDGTGADAATGRAAAGGGAENADGPPEPSTVGGVAAEPSTDGPDVDVLQVERDGGAYYGSGSDQPIEAGDGLVVRGSLQAVNEFASRHELRYRSRETVTEEGLVEPGHDGTLVEAVAHADSGWIGRTVADLHLRDRFDTTVLAVRRDGAVVREALDELTVAAGDTLLLRTTADAVEYFAEAGYLVVTETAEDVRTPAERTGTRPAISEKAPVAIGTLLGVVLVAALDLVSITIAALGGVVVLVAAGAMSVNRAYDAVSWSVIFLLAGLLPLGVTMQQTGGAEFVASLLVGVGEGIPPVALLGLFYVVTALVAAIITPVATVVLMIPVAVDTAQRLGAEGVPFLLVVTFAAANAFVTPIGYQTNLMVYGPGGYKFTDYLRVGGPLQLLLAVVTTLSVAALWPP